MSQQQSKKADRFFGLDRPVVEVFSELMFPIAADKLINDIYARYLRQHIRSVDGAEFDWDNYSVKAVSINSNFIVAGVLNPSNVILENPNNYCRVHTNLFHASIAVYTLALAHFFELVTGMADESDVEFETINAKRNDYLPEEIERVRVGRMRIKELAEVLSEQYSKTREVLGGIKPIADMVARFLD